MKTILISAVLACSVTGAIAQDFVPNATDMFDLDRQSMARDLNCMREKLECSGIDGLVGVTPGGRETAVKAAYQCLKDYIDCMRGSLNQTAAAISKFE